MKRIFLLAALALGGCVLVGQDQAERGRTALNGKTKAEILACAGIPSGAYRSGNVEYLGYSGSGMFRGGSSTYTGNGVFIHSPSGRSECIVTMALTNGRVTSVNYRSSGGALIAPDEACGTVVRGCL